MNDQSPILNVRDILPEISFLPRAILPGSSLVAGPFEPAICLIHADGPVVIALAVERFDHAAGGILIDLYPCVHLPQVDLTQYFFFQVAFIKNELQETGFVKTILGAQVDEEAGITTVAAVELTAVSSASCFLHTAPAVSAFRAVQVFGILVIFQEMIEFKSGYPLQYFFLAYCFESQPGYGRDQNRICRWSRL